MSAHQSSRRASSSLFPGRDHPGLYAPSLLGANARTAYTWLNDPDEIEQPEQNLAGLRFQIPSRASGSGPGIFGKLFASVILLAFLAAGGFFTYLVARGVAASARTYGWNETPCEIVVSRVVRNPPSTDPDQAFVFDVEYRYEVGGHSYTSRQFRPGYSGSPEIVEAARLSQRHPPGSRAVCYVDPGNPQNATLERPSLWTALIILFPLLFVIVGAGGLLAMWWPRAPAAEETGAQRAISRKAAPAGKALGCLAAFFGLFFAVGLATCYFFFARPAMRILAARSWRETPCVVLESRVRTHRGDDGNTYSVDVLYEYAFDGRRYQSNRYQFLGGSSGGSESKEAVTARLSPGTRTICYVNPADPQEAVLTRSFTKEYLVAIVPFVFMLAGGGGLLWVASLGRKARAAAAGASRWGLAAALTGAGTMRFAEAEVERGPVVLEPAARPVTRFAITVGACLFWNGVVSVLVWQAIKGWRSGHPDGCLTLFAVPFVLVGLLLIWGVVYQFLALFNPRPRVTLSSRSIPLGGSATLDWSFSGAASRIGRLRISVEGREECRYRRGTDTHTDKATFATIEVMDGNALAGQAVGSGRVTIPAGTMHSFSAPNNKIVWALKLKGEIRSWPDVEEEFEILVTPARSAPQGNA